MTEEEDCGNDIFVQWFKIIIFSFLTYHVALVANLFDMKTIKFLFCFNFSKRNNLKNEYFCVCFFFWKNHARLNFFN